MPTHEYLRFIRLTSPDGILPMHLRSLTLLALGTMGGPWLSALEIQTIRGQASWVVRSDRVELALTQRGGHMAPVTFQRQDAIPIRPYAISPWQGEDLPLADVPVLVPLRGDFFCIPFGGNGTPFNGERHPPHGETAGSPWTLVGSDAVAGVTTLRVALATQVRQGRIERDLSLVAGQDAVYSQTRILGFAGPAPMAHHAILALPDDPGVLRITVRPFRFGFTAPYRFSDPAKGEYQALAIGGEFHDLTQVPTLFKDPATTDCSAFPARRGYADLLQTCNGSNETHEPDWIAAVHTTDRWLWYALKDPAVLPSRVFWMENHGRHAIPWKGRNNCLGLEDSCTFFDAGVAESAGDNLINQRGVPTCHRLTGEKPFIVNYLQGVVPVPAGFDQVASVRFEADGVIFTATGGQTARAQVRPGFVFDGQVQPR